MKILYLIPWPKPFEDTNIDLSEIVNTQFGYYTLKNANQQLKSRAGSVS